MLNWVKPMKITQVKQKMTLCFYAVRQRKIYDNKKEMKMTNVIDLIESMGSTANFGEGCNTPLSADLHSEVVEALEARDSHKLNELLGGRGKIYCALATPGEQQDEFADERDDELLKSA
ncbi:hypothetical protein [Shewanella waksmanii]|uniref:hypothetical protein n=1 Tax=Shewanella waksmanii TaxID=213783 RepID=UPI00373571EE